MNDELRHANNYKYIKREWKNGKWQYTYEDSKGNRGTSSKNPAPKSGKASKIVTNYKRKGLVEVSTNRSGVTEIKEAPYAKGRWRFNHRNIKTTGVIRKDGPDNQYAENQNTSKGLAEKKKDQKYLNSLKKTKESSYIDGYTRNKHTVNTYEDPKKWKDSKKEYTFGNGDVESNYIKGKVSITKDKVEKKLDDVKDVAKQKVTEIKATAKESIAKGNDWLKKQLDTLNEKKKKR